MRLAGVLAALLVVISASLSVFAIDTTKFPKRPQLYAEAAVLMNADTGQILYGKNENQQMYPASLTKIMTCLLAMERGNYNDIVTVREEAMKDVAGTTHIVLSEGEQLTMEQLLYAVMLESANDAASAVGIHLAGSINMFSELMNQKAQALGATGTHFVNANGLPDDNHYTTAADLALITKAALQFPEFRKFAGTHKYTIPATNTHVERVVTHRNYMFVLNDTYEGAFAGKTGWTQEAGKCLMTVAERNGVTLIAIVLKSAGVVDAEFVDSTALFDYGFDHFRAVSIPWTRFPSQQVAYTDAQGVAQQGRLYPALASVGNLSVLLADGVEESDLVPSTFLPQPLTEENLSRIRFELKLPEVAGEVQNRIAATYPVEVRPLDMQDEIGVPEEEEAPFPWGALAIGLLIVLVVLLVILCCFFWFSGRLVRMYYRSYFNTRHRETSPDSDSLYFLQNHASSEQDWIVFRKRYAKQKRFLGASLEDIAILREVRAAAKKRQTRKPTKRPPPSPPPRTQTKEETRPLVSVGTRPTGDTAKKERAPTRPRRSNRPF